MLSSLYNRFFPESRLRIGLSGLDYCGKTTLVYKLKHGEAVTTIPTIGVVFITADLDIPTSKGTIKCTVWETGIPGCTATPLRTILKSVLFPSAAIIWLVDATDRDRLSESIEELSGLFQESSTAGIGKLPIGTPILILATKQDLPNCMPLTEIRAKVDKIIPGHKVAIFGVCLIQKGISSDLKAAFDWLQAALKNLPLPAPPSSSTSAPKRQSPAVEATMEDALEKKVASWVTRAETDSSPGEFLSQFDSINLPSWDHYTHIRLAYVMIMKFGRRKGKDMIFEGIERYIKQSSQTRGRTFHVTMTYFWVHFVHFGIANMPAPQSPSHSSDENEARTFGKNELDFMDSHISTETSDYATIVDDSSSVWTLVPTLSPSKHPENEEFARFLIMNPFVARGNLWEDYYSRDVMMSLGAKERMVLPDKKPFPNIISLTSSG
ncbi:hypothetical protein GYMLUDRAFT_86532 [Collybiopsis luxurians FD-317 M1]|uniref:ADP-ribosylation factor n=1 Tax=Collybiopsis luxurians FD-317 M1 TaxID=944289 RepID=A0A0D0C613_9AGAR|nr:hypothetical protein GYMLUDRAFT_86532 [Collybiopsis luxurians FD-317 M1]